MDSRQGKWSIKRKYGVTDHLRELNLCTDIKVPTSAIYLHISSTLAHSMYDVGWHCEVNCMRSKDTQKQLARTSLRCYLSILKLRDSFYSLPKVQVSWQLCKKDWDPVTATLKKSTLWDANNRNQKRDCNTLNYDSAENFRDPNIW